ncbi:MAG: DUF4388 domain-containing protein [Planctomycetes bacterium]|nr:DUF4388 domain-containing protein [Planctomycetota bacterium]
MAFKGELSKLPIADVMQSIHQNSMSGALAIRDDYGERLIAFEAGMVTGCAVPEGREHGIAEELVRRRVVDQKQVKSSRFFRRKGGLKGSLKRRNILDSEAFVSLARTLVLERIYDCFLLETGGFEFLEEYDKSRFDPDELAADIRIQPSSILMEAMRRVDEWQRIKRAIPSFREVYVAGREPSEDDEELDAELLRLTGPGELTLEAVFDQLPQPRFTCSERVLELVNRGALRVATAPEYLKLGKAATAAGDLDLAMSHFRRGLVYERGNPELNQLLVEVLERKGDKQAAADERKRFAGVLLEQGNRQGAKEQFAKVSELVPSDPLPLERLLDLQVEAKEEDAAQVTAKRLVGVYVKLGLGEKAKGVYPRLLMLKPKDSGLRQALAETHATLNENAVAATIYKELAQAALDARDEAQATKRLRRAQELTPDDPKLRGWLKDLESGAHAQRRKQRRRYLVLTVFMILVGLAGVWVSYEAQGLRYLQQASVGSFDSVDGGPEGVLDAIARHEDQLQNLPTFAFFAREWGDAQVRALIRLYVRELERSGHDLRLPPVPAPPAPTLAVEKDFTRAFKPWDDTPPLSALIDQAEEVWREAVANPERAEALLTQARELTQEARQRVADARAALARGGGADRKKYGEQLSAELPRLYRVVGLLEVRSPAVRELLTLDPPEEGSPEDHAAPPAPGDGETPPDDDADEDPK